MHVNPLTRIYIPNFRPYAFPSLHYPTHRLTVRQTICYINAEISKKLKRDIAYRVQETLSAPLLRGHIPFKISKI